MSSIERQREIPSKHESLLNPEEQRVIDSVERSLRDIIPEDIRNQATRIVSTHGEIYTSELLNFARLGRPPKIGENQKLEMAQIYEEDDETTLKSLGEQFDLSHEHIRRLLKEQGVSLRHTGRPFKLVVEKRKEVARLYQKGDPMSTLELGEKFEVSRTTISNSLEEQGVNRRPRGTPKGLEIIGLPMEIIEQQYTSDRKTIEELSQEYPASAMTIWRRLKKRGVKMRNRGSQKR